MTPQDQLIAVGLVALATALGAAIGYERAHAAKAAGLRTNALVAGAAALVVLLGEALLGGVAGGGDSSRALHGVITGIGFLGAGAIVKGDDGQAGGLTTAATIFVVAAIGATTGAGYPILATGSAVLVLLVLRGLQRFDPAGRTNGSRSVVDGSAGELSGRLVLRSQVRTSPLPSSSSVPGKTRRRQGSSRRAPNASEVGPSDQAGTIAGS